MSWLDAILRRARLRGLKEGQVQTVRSEATEHDARDAVERWQDYGFAGNPVDGQGLKIELGGHTVVIRMDRIAERPQLEAFEVAVWHKEGHMVRLRAGRLVQVDCDRLVINASAQVDVNSPVINLNADQVAASSNLSINGVEHSTHRHVETGGTTHGPTP